MEHRIMLLNISAISVAKPHLSSTPVPSTCVRCCCQGRCSRFTECWCQAVIITLLLLQNLKWGQLWFHCCLRDVPGFGLFPQNPCLCISFLPLFLTQPSVSPCVSLLPPLCWQAARSYGRRRGNVWYFLWGSVCQCPAVSLSEAEGGLNVVPLSAFHLCCDWNHINFDTVFPCCAFNQYGATIHQIYLCESCFARWWKQKKKKNPSANFLLSLFWVSVLPVIFIN